MGQLCSFWYMLPRQVCWNQLPASPQTVLCPTWVPATTLPPGLPHLSRAICLLGVSTLSVVKGQHLKYLQFSRPSMYIFHKSRLTVWICSCHSNTSLVHPSTCSFWPPTDTCVRSQLLAWAKSVVLAICCSKCSGARTDLLFLLCFELQEIQEDLLLD